MPYSIKIAIFWAGLGVATWLLKRYPGSLPARIAFSWKGPFPVIGEKRSAFYVRRARFAAKCFLRILALSLVLMSSVKICPWLQQQDAEVVGLGMGLIIGGGMAAVGGLGALFIAMKTKIWGPDPKFKRMDDGDDGEREDVI